jgi:hypothetical protein
MPPPCWARRCHVFRGQSSPGALGSIAAALAIAAGAAPAGKCSYRYGLNAVTSKKLWSDRTGLGYAASDAGTAYAFSLPG